MSASGQIVSFYSYKGGVGRSMALANTAVLLAHAGKRVWVIDFDLEAPGLHRYFLKSDQERFKAPAPQAGTIDLFTDLRARLDADFLAEGTLTKDLAAGGQRLRDIVSSLLSEDRFRYTVRVNNPNTRPATHAELAFTSAGHFDGGYAERVRRFDWQGFYDTYAEVFPILAEELRRRFDYVLIDSRTGITDTGSVCTVLLPDKLVLCFTTNEQSLYGAVELGQQAVLQRAHVEPGRSLGLFPLPLRLENAEQELQRRYMQHAQERFEAAFRAAYGLERCDLTKYFQVVRVRHDSFYAYGEEIAAERDASAVIGSLAEAFIVFRMVLDAQGAREADEVLGKVDQTVRLAKTSPQTLLDQITPDALDPSMRWVVPLLQSQVLYQQGRVREALTTLDSALPADLDQRSPTEHVFYVPALIAKGDISLLLGEYEAGLGLMEQALRILEKNAPGAPLVHGGVLLGKARALFLLGRYEDATALLNQILKDSALPSVTHIAARIASADILAANGHGEPALALYSEMMGQVQAAPPPDSEALFARALVGTASTYLMLGRPVEALSRSQNVIDRLGTHGDLGARRSVFEAWLWKSAALLQLGRIAEAHAAVVQANGLMEQGPDVYPRPNRAILMQIQAAVFISAHQYEDAIDQVDRAIAQFQRDRSPAVHQHVVWCIVIKYRALLLKSKRASGTIAPAEFAGHLAQLRDSLREADQQYPGNPWFIATLGYVLFLLGERDEAAMLLKKAIELGGEALRQAKLADSEIEPVPQDEDFRDLLRSIGT